MNFDLQKQTLSGVLSNSEHTLWNCTFFCMVQYVVKLYAELYYVLLKVAFVYYNNTFLLDQPSEIVVSQLSKCFQELQYPTFLLNPIQGLQTIGNQLQYFDLFHQKLQ